MGAAVVFAGSVDMQPGEWSITTTTKVEGMPMAPPPSTYKTCLTEKDLVPPPGDKKDPQAPDCEIKDQKVSGNTVSWSMVCTMAQGGTVDGTGSVTYAGTTFEGKTDMTMDMGGQKMTIHNTMSGKRLGACKE
jgi:hypothetical protein